MSTFVDGNDTLDLKLRRSWAGLFSTAKVIDCKQSLLAVLVLPSNSFSELTDHTRDNSSYKDKGVKNDLVSIIAARLYIELGPTNRFKPKGDPVVWDLLATVTGDENPQSWPADLC